MYQYKYGHHYKLTFLIILCTFVQVPVQVLGSRNFIRNSIRNDSGFIQVPDYVIELETELETKIEKVNTVLLNFVHYYERRFNQINEEIGQIEYNISGCTFEKFNLELAQLKHKVKLLQENNA